MSNVTIQTQVSSELKKEAEAVFSALGMTTAEAIHIFLQQAVHRGGLPFLLVSKTPNQETLAAMEELENNEGQMFATTDALFADWNQ